MIKHKRLPAIFLLAMLLPLLCAAKAFADKNPVGFFVSPVLPSNQIDPNVNFFSLRTEEGQEQTLEVLVVNENDREIKVSVEVNKAFTNANGVIEYTASANTGGKPETDWTRWITIEEPIFTVKARQSAVARLHLSVPEEPFEGDLLGGILFVRIDDEEEKPVDVPASGIKIENIFMYCVAVQITQRDTETLVPPEFAITGARMDTIAGFPALVLDAQNKKPLIVLGATLETAVYSTGGGQAVLTHETAFAMAPNSTAPLTKVLAGEEKLLPGTYRVEVTLTYLEQSWHFELPLQVES